VFHFVVSSILMLSLNQTGTIGRDYYISKDYLKVIFTSLEITSDFTVSSCMFTCVLFSSFLIARWKHADGSAVYSV
jgi:hypothetical protein